LFLRSQIQPNKYIFIKIEGRKVKINSIFYRYANFHKSIVNSILGVLHTTNISKHLINQSEERIS